MNKKQIAITLGIMCFILTVAICIQLKTIENTTTTISQSLKENGLRDEVLRWKERYDNVYEELNQSLKELEEVRKQATQNDTKSSAKQEEIKNNNMLLGLSEVKGEGLQIVIADNNTGTLKNESEALDLSSQVVHYDDLIEVINALNNAGAEAISINNQRIILTTPIICGGNTININGERIGSPFEIKAIGSPEALANLSRPGGYLSKLEKRGIKVGTIKKSNSITIPKYTGVLNFKYISNSN